MLRNKQYIIFFVILFCITVSVFAFGGREKEVKKPVVQVTGMVRLVGNEPFTELVISSSEFVWYAANNEIHKLRDLQHRIVTIEGEETIIELTFANGMPAGIRRELGNIRIISVEQ